jgi:hypothetical protein
MIYSATVLAQGRGHVVISTEWDTSTSPWRRTDRLIVRRLDRQDQLVEETTIDRVQGEDARDCKSRAIAAVRMLGYWPELRRSIAEDRRDRGHVDLPAAPKNLQATVDQLTDAGLILPPGMEWTR